MSLPENILDFILWLKIATVSWLRKSCFSKPPMSKVCICVHLRKEKNPEQTFLCALSLLTFIEITKQLFKGHKVELKVAFYLLTFKGGIACLTFSESCSERIYSVLSGKCSIMWFFFFFKLNVWISKSLIG